MFRSHEGLLQCDSNSPQFRFEHLYSSRTGVVAEDHSAISG